MSYQNISNGKLTWSQITMQSAKYFTATVESPFTMTKIQNQGQTSVCSTKTRPVR